jgi:hypothetical protein
MDFGCVSAKSGASNATFTCEMTPCGSAAARHPNLKPDRPVCLPTLCPVDRSVTGLCKTHSGLTANGAADTMAWFSPSGSRIRVQNRARTAQHDIEGSQVSRKDQRKTRAKQSRAQVQKRNQIWKKGHGRQEQGITSAHLWAIADTFDLLVSAGTAPHDIPIWEPCHEGLGISAAQ